jgi:hypothetical protein
MKILFIVLFLSLIFSTNSFSQKKESTQSKTFMDEVQSLFEVRKSFDTKSETTKPAQLSYKKNNDEEAKYTFDVAVLYKKFNFKNYGIAPAIQLEYSSNPKDKQQTLKGSLLGYFNILNFGKNYIKFEPSVSYTKDFFYKTETLDGKIYLVPRLPDFFVPIMNVSKVKFNYEKDDNRWVLGFNPVFGLEYRNRIDENKSSADVSLYSITAGEITLKRFYIELDVHGRYEKELEKNRNYTYKYGTGITIYFDEKERSSLNMKYEKEEKLKTKNTKTTIGIGLKL